MSHTNFPSLLLREDLHREDSARILRTVTDQESFDELFALIFHHDRSLVVRAADTVEKISQVHPEYIQLHKEQLLAVMRSGDHKELKVHVAPLLALLTLNEIELNNVWHVLTYWALNRNENKTVRVSALQGLFDLSRQFPHVLKDFGQTMQAMERETIPSLQARIRKLQKLAVLN